MNEKPKVSVGYVIREASLMNGDADMNHGVSRGWYKSQARLALDQLNFETNFDDGHEMDIMIDKPSMQMEIPEGVWDIQMMHAWSGTKYIPGNAVRVYPKDNFQNNLMGSASYLSNRRDDKELFPVDPLQQGDILRDHVTSNLLYYDIQNGMIMLGATCSAYTNIHIKYAGLYGSDICDVECVPRYMILAVRDFMRVSFCNVMLSEDIKKYSVMLSVASKDMDDPRTGSWGKAKRIANRMMSDERESENEYQARMDY